MSDSSGRVVNPNPSVSDVFGAEGEGVGEGGVLTIYSSDSEGVLFSHKFINAVMAPMGEVTIGELVTVEALTSTNVIDIKNGEREGR